MTNKLKNNQAKKAPFQVIILLLGLLLLNSTIQTTATAASKNNLAPNWQLTPTPEPTPLPTNAPPIISDFIEDIELNNPAPQPAPTTPFSITFEELGYTQRDIQSPLGTASFNFRLPPTWIVEEDNFIQLDFDYFFEFVDSDNFITPSAFGQLIVLFNGDILKTIRLESNELLDSHLQIPLPAAELNEDPDRRHTIQVVLDTSALCQMPHEALVLIQPTSFIAINYQQIPLIADLATYPQPFYQRAFDPDEIRVVMPQKPTLAEATGIMQIISKLGDLTNNNMTISTTLDIDLINSLTTQPNKDNIYLDEHLFVIGQPTNNQFLSLLESSTTIPIPLKARELDLSTTGPVNVIPNQTFTYLFTVTNSSDTDRILRLTNTLAKGTQFLDCNPDCSQDPITQLINWSNYRLAPGQVNQFSLTVVTPSTLNSAYFENTIALIDDEQGPINVDTLVSKVSNIPLGLAQLNKQQTSSPHKSQYFFIYNNLPVAESDGIIQEIISPWHNNRAILIITGLNDTALQKAAYALSSELELPGMTGSVALIQEVLPFVASEEAPPKINFTFEDLGYSDKVVVGSLGDTVEYNFFLPNGWSLTKDSIIDVNFSHTQLIEFSTSGLTVSFNRTPIADTILSAETAQRGTLSGELSNSAAKPGVENSIQVQFDLGDVDGCESGQVDKFWFNIKNDSSIYLDYQEVSYSFNSLKIYPIPYSNKPSLVNVLYALPAQPSTMEWDGALRVATTLGNYAGGDTIVPAVALGESISTGELADYHIITFGRPSRNPILAQVNNKLPQPFLVKTDEIIQTVDDVIFRLPPDFDLGYVQLIPSPWNEDRNFLAATGTTDLGVEWAARSLYVVSLQNDLNGDLALVQDDIINTINTSQVVPGRLWSVVLTMIPAFTATPIVTTTESLSNTTTTTNTASLPPPTTGIPDPPSPWWVMPLMAFTGITILVIFLIAFWQSRRAKKKKLLR